MIEVCEAERNGRGKLLSSKCFSSFDLSNILDQYSLAIPTVRRQKNKSNHLPIFFFFVTSIQFVARWSRNTA